MNAKGARVWTRNFALLAAATFCYFLAFMFFFPTLPFYITALGMRESEMGLLLGTSAFTSLLLRPWSGRLIGRIGSRQAMSLGAALFTVCVLAYNVAVNVPLMLVVRVIWGAALSVYITGSSTFVAEIAPPQRRGEAFSQYGMANTLASAAGPSIGFFLIEGAALAGLNQALARAMPWGGAALAPRFNFGVLFTTASLLAVTALVLTRLLQDVRAPARGAAAAFLERSALFPGVVSLLLMIGMAAQIVFLPLWARRVGLENVGLLFTALAVSLFVVRTFAGQLSDRYGRGAAIVPGLALMGVALVAFALVAAPWQLFPVGVAFAFGQGMAQPALNALAVDRAGPENRATAMATYSIGTDAGLSLGGLLLGFVLQHAGFGPAFFTAAGFVGAGLAVFALGALRRPAGATERASPTAEAGG